MIALRKLTMSVIALAVSSAFLAGAAAEFDFSKLPNPSFTHAGPGEKGPDPDGFLQRWFVLEPINIGNQQTENASKAAVKKEYFPNQLTVIPHDGDQVTVDSASLVWHAVDTTKYNVNLYHFGTALNKSSANALFWAVTIVNCPQEMTNVRLAIGSNASSVWWVNGEQVTAIYGDRQTVVDDGVSKRLTLKKGANVVRCAVINGSGATDFCARFLDANDKPVTGITTSLSESK